MTTPAPATVPQATIPAPPRHRRLTHIVAPLALIAVTLLAYSPALRGGWIWDDDYYVTNNVTLRSASGLWRIWTEIGAVPQYYPVTHTTFWLERRLWGDRPTGYHVTNVLLHCASALLVGVILRRLSVPGWWLVPWLFALHPVHVESVAWVTERKNVLSAFFYLLALLTYLGLDEKRGMSPLKKGTSLFYGRYLLALSLFVCALLSKSVTSSWPAVVLLIVYWKRGRITKADVLPLLPFFALGLAMGSLTSWMERHVVGAAGKEFDFTIADRVLIAGRAVWFYVTKLAWPNPLIFMYPRWRIDDRAIWQYIFPLAAIGLLIALWLLRHRVGRGPLVAALFFGGSLLPALGFVNVLPMRYAFVADHFQYLASLGLLTLFAAGVARCVPRGVIPHISVAVCLALAIVTWRHARDFADLETLWRRTLEKNPASWMARTNYGALLMERDPASAAAQFRAAIALKPDHDQARLNMGRLYQQQGKPEAAREMYLDAIRVHPGFANAYYNLAALAASQGQTDEAIKRYRQTIEYDPRHAGAYAYLGQLLASRGERGEAERVLRQALAIDPDLAPAHTGLGNLLLDAGRFDAALAEFARAAALEPQNPVVRNNIGIALAKRDRLDDAERMFRESLRLKPDYVEAMVNLGIVRARRGDVAGARELFARALALDPGNDLARRQVEALPSQ
jgi:Flp pilus assembly protein TadD